MVAKLDVIMITFLVVLFTWFILPMPLTFTNNGAGRVLISTRYIAGTIQDNETYNVIGYNITFTYRGITANTQVLCPLYPAGSAISVSYQDWFFIFPYLTVSNLPQGCQTNTRPS
jgi:hypothetical protein